MAALSVHKIAGAYSISIPKASCNLARSSGLAATQPPTTTDFGLSLAYASLAFATK